MGDGAGFGDFFPGFVEQGAEALDLIEAAFGGSDEEGFDVGVLGEDGVAGVETGGAFFGGDDEFHGFIETGIITRVDEAWADADGEFVFLGEVKGGSGGDGVEELLEAIALVAFITGHGFKGVAEFSVAGFFGKDDVTVGRDGFTEGGDGEGLVVGDFGEIGGGEFFTHCGSLYADGGK